MKAKDLDKIFDDGEIDINDHLDLSKAFRPGQEQKRVNVDFPLRFLKPRGVPSPFWPGVGRTLSSGPHNKFAFAPYYQRIFD